MRTKPFSRRDFLQVAALSVGAYGTGMSRSELSGDAPIVLVMDPGDPLASAAPVTWALQELQRALAQRGSSVSRVDAIEGAPRSQFCIVAAGLRSGIAASALKSSGVVVSEGPETLALAPARYEGRRILLACGSDARGLMYALLELTDRVRHAENALEALNLQKPMVEQPFNEVRSIARMFVSEVEDKPWFQDREMWRAYFAMLATNRFNRFSLNFGIGYDTLRNVSDSYLLFAYPFLLQVPGYDVRAANLPDSERDHNLDKLRFISRQAAAHGIDFHLGIWTHGYEWMDTPRSNYMIEGITPQNHAAYSRDALAALLKACPDMSGVTLRTHGESGIREGSYIFWQTVFAGIAQSGRKVELDLHTKGLDQRLLDSAVATGMPIKLSPKYWAEHQGLPYQQSAIRALEMPGHADASGDFYTLSTGSRIFTRYGYADFLREDRRYSVMYRIWPGTHRFLLWGDPVSTAAHARAFRFCGSNGAELCEPLSFKGRRGSGLGGGRCGYADSSLEPAHDWEKYDYTYRVWGRLTYNPDCDPDTWRRLLRKKYPTNPVAVECALGAASRIIPLVTTAHLPSAANDTYGPEFYTNQSMVDSGKYGPYGDTPSPKIFENVSPLDPRLFSGVHDFAAELLGGQRSGKYTPAEVAQWLEDLADTAAAQLKQAENQAGAGNPEFRRMAADVRIQIGLGRFFAAKFRSGSLFAIHQQTQDRTALEESLNAYRRAREIWSEFATGAARVYVPDITYGPLPHQRGHWMDRLPAIDEDIAAMAKRLEALPAGTEQTARVRSAIQEVLSRPRRETLRCQHTPPGRLVPGKDLELQLSIDEPAQAILVRLYYRHVNQAEPYQSADARAHDGSHRATIPASYTASPYPVQYYFEMRQGPEKAWLYPGFAQDLSNQPYFVVSPSSVYGMKTLDTNPAGATHSAALAGFFPETASLTDIPASAK